MIKKIFNLRLCVALAIGLLAVDSVEAQQRAQGGGQRTGGGGQRTGGGGQRTGSGGARTSSGTSSGSYYAPGEVGEAIISVDPETRKIIVITDEDTNQYLSNVVHSLDRPKPQVLIKVVFLEVTYRNTLDLGIEGAYRKGFGSGATGVFGQSFGLGALNAAPSNTTFNQFGQPTSSLGPTPPGAGLYQVLGQDFQVTLRAIAQAGKTEILSRPSILTRNNQQATISLGQEVPLVSNTRFDAVNGQINTVTYQNVGIILRVTPFITSDGMVEMIVAPETSALADRSQWVPISRDALAPVINSRMADTVVVVPDGQTVIIGGLMQNAKDDLDSKVPFLSQIPLLGNLFKHKSKNNEKTELMIFLTPHIVAEPTQLASLTTSEGQKVQLAPKSFTEEELNRYLDNLPGKLGPTNAPPEKVKRKKSKSQD
jgi:type II secretion system protein D